MNNGIISVINVGSMLKIIYFCIKSMRLWNLPAETDYLRLHLGEVDIDSPLSNGLFKISIRIIHLLGSFLSVLWLPFALHCSVWISCFYPAVMFSFLSRSQNMFKVRVHETWDFEFRYLSCSEPAVCDVNQLHNLIVPIFLA